MAYPLLWLVKFIRGWNQSWCIQIEQLNYEKNCSHFNQKYFFPVWKRLKRVKKLVENNWSIAVTNKRRYNSLRNSVEKLKPVKH